MMILASIVKPENKEGGPEESGSPFCLGGAMVVDERLHWSASLPVRAEYSQYGLGSERILESVSTPLSPPHPALFFT